MKTRVLASDREVIGDLTIYKVILGKRRNIPLKAGDRVRFVGWQEDRGVRFVECEWTGIRFWAMAGVFWALTREVSDV